MDTCITRCGGASTWLRYDNAHNVKASDESLRIKTKHAPGRVRLNVKIKENERKS